MSDAQKDRLADNVASGLMHASESAQLRMLLQYEKADPVYVALVQARL
jgi:catalase